MPWPPPWPSSGSLAAILLMGMLEKGPHPRGQASQAEEIEGIPTPTQLSVQQSQRSTGVGEYREVTGQALVSGLAETAAGASEAPTFWAKTLGSNRTLTQSLSPHRNPPMTDARPGPRKEDPHPQFLLTIPLAHSSFPWVPLPSHHHPNLPTLIPEPPASGPLPPHGFTYAVPLPGTHFLLLALPYPSACG